MWYPHKQKIIKFKDYTKELEKFTGELDDIQTKIFLAKYFKSNLGLSFELLNGGSVQLYELQELILRAMFIRDNGMIVAARGFSKSYLIAFFSIIYPLFVFGSKICLISANFRSSRRILEYCETIINNPRASLLKECFPDRLQRSNDMYRFKIPNPCGSEVFALPLSTGQGLRGTRASVVVVDEGLLISKDIQEYVIRPFLTAKQNLQEELEIKAREDELIKAGVITEEDRISFPKNKYFVFSSASYEFEYLFDMFKTMVDGTFKEVKDNDTPAYFVMRSSYEALAENTHIDTTQINAAKENGGENTDYFKREYRGLFTSSSDGYFSVKKMHECTVPLGDVPTIQIKGDKASKYILAIDPSYSASKSSDFFAIGTYLLNEDERKITLVHTYGRAGGDLKDHFAYFAYLLSYFNVVFVVNDASGSEFISGFNESTLAKEKNLKVEFIHNDLCFDTDDSKEYNEQIKLLKNNYNISNKKIVYGQKFNTANNAIRRMNEALQNSINAKKVWFASSCRNNEKSFNRQKDINLPIEYKNQHGQVFGVVEMIEDQDIWITETKNQVALIEVQATSAGVLQYNLPQSLRRATGDNRCRRDHYSCLLIANWAAKIYFDMMTAPEEQVNFNTFDPIVLR